MGHIGQSQDTLVGFCAQTIIEAEALVRAGASDILITNMLPPKAALSLAVLASKNPNIQFGTLVDCLEHVKALDNAATSLEVRLKALVEVECGMDRCGVPAGSDALVQLAQAIISAQSLDWGGLQVYAGNLGQISSFTKRQSAVAEGPGLAARKSVERLKANGIKVPLITGGGTGTVKFDIKEGTHTELQPGSYLLMDKNYSKNEDIIFKQALYVHSTCVSSDENSGKRVIDAGTKEVDILFGIPKVTSIMHKELANALSHCVYSAYGCEHGILRNVPNGVLKVGDTLQLVPSDLYATVNRYSSLVGVRNDHVETLFPIDARYTLNFNS